MTTEPLRSAAQNAESRQLPAEGPRASRGQGAPRWALGYALGDDATALGDDATQRGTHSANTDPSLGVRHGDRSVEQLGPSPQSAAPHFKTQPSRSGPYVAPPPRHPPHPTPHACTTRCPDKTRRSQSLGQASDSKDVAWTGVPARPTPRACVSREPRRSDRGRPVPTILRAQVAPQIPLERPLLRAPRGAPGGRGPARLLLPLSRDMAGLGTGTGLGVPGLKPCPHRPPLQLPGTVFPHKHLSGLPRGPAAR